MSQKLKKNLDLQLDINVSSHMSHQVFTLHTLLNLDKWTEMKKLMEYLHSIVLYVEKIYI